MTLKHTLDNVQQRELEHVETVGRPNPWWPGGLRTNDCVGYQTERLGLRTGNESLAWLSAHPHMISIAAFRAFYQWPEVPPEQIRPGDLVLSNWTGTRVDGRLEPEHMEWVYSVDRSAPSIVIVGANTGPEAGDPEPNGVWRKTRPLNQHIVLGIRPPYRPERPSRARRKYVATVAEFVNRTVPPGLPRTTAANPGKDWGLEGHNYRVLVQTWGRMRGIYGTGYKVDGVFGARSKLVEAAAHKAATARK